VALAILLVAALCFVRLAGGGTAWAQDTAGMLEKNGIRYPEGFDVNTVGEVKGKVGNIVRPQKGPLMFDVSGGRETYKIVAAPSWFWEDLKLKIAAGDEVRVVGSKALGKDGNLYVVAQEIHLPGSSQSVAIRDKDGAALWRMPAAAAGSRGGYGAFGGRGGPAGGFGGGGHGGRR
jgi:hypothetical protein